MISIKTERKWRLHCSKVVISKSKQQNGENKTAYSVCSISFIGIQSKTRNVYSD